MKAFNVVDQLAALAHLGRLDLFRLLVRRAPDAVAAGEIAAALGVRATTLSNQLSQLESAGLIRSSREGRSIRYQADLDAAGALLGFLAADCCKGRPEVCQPIAAPFLRRAVWDRSWDGEGGGEKRDLETQASQDDLRRNVLFLCTGNSARSIFAEAILRGAAPDRFGARSAGAQPRGAIDPDAAAVLEHFGHDVSGLASKGWEAFLGPAAPTFDFVFTVCDDAANAACPVWPGQPISAHWGVPDPAAAEGATRRAAFEAAYRQLERRISTFAELPFARLGPIELQRELDAIGQSAGARTPVPASDPASSQARLTQTARKAAR